MYWSKRLIKTSIGGGGGSRNSFLGDAGALERDFDAEVQATPYKRLQRLVCGESVSLGKGSESRGERTVDSLS